MQTFSLASTKFAVVCFLSALLGSCGGRVELLTAIPESEANEVLSALMDVGIKASKLPGKEGMVSIDVVQGDVTRAIATMRTEGLPRERFMKMGEVFRKEGLISSPLEERARYLWALSQELSATVAQIDGVLKARVHVVLPERSTGGDPAMPSSAAVFIKHKPGYNLEEATPQIKRLVANSISGLSVEKVTVVLLPAISKEQAEKNGASAMSKVNGKNGNSSYTGPLNGDLIWLLLGLFFLCLVGLGYLAWRKWGGAILNQSNSASSRDSPVASDESAKVIGAKAV